MEKKVLLVGHCGPDSSYLKMAIKSAVKSVSIRMADDDTELKSALMEQPDLILFNRELGYGFDIKLGVDLIQFLRKAYPGTGMILVSNYADAQAAAVAAGALPGFGKREMGSQRVVSLIRDVLEKPVKAESKPAQKA